MKTIEELIAACKERDLPVTAQRLAILRILQEMEGHPTVEDIYKKVLQEIPSISLATVYKNLEVLTQHGLVTQVARLHGITRYDVNNEPHHHLMCVQCRKIVDVEDEVLPRLTLPEEQRRGFEVFNYQIQFEGLCEECRKT